MVRRLRRLGRDRPPLPPSGRDRYAVLRHRGLDTADDGAVTVRERDTMAQERSRWRGCAPGSRAARRLLTCRMPTIAPPDRHNDPVTASRRARTASSAALIPGLLLSGCGESDEKPKAKPSVDLPTGNVDVPEGVTLTKPGTELNFKERAVVPTSRTPAGSPWFPSRWSPSRPAGSPTSPRTGLTTAPRTRGRTTCGSA